MIIFCRADSNEDGRITREEVQEVSRKFDMLWLSPSSLNNQQFLYFSDLQLIMLSASANKLSKLKEQAEEYASLIMEELDPENLGYIEVKKIEIDLRVIDLTL